MANKIECRVVFHDGDTAGGVAGVKMYVYVRDPGQAVAMLDKEYSSGSNDSVLVKEPAAGSPAILKRQTTTFFTLSAAGRGKYKVLGATRWPENMSSGDFVATLFPDRFALYEHGGDN